MARLPAEISPSDPSVRGSERLDRAEEPPACFVVASVGDLSEGYGHGGPGICLGNGQTKAEKVL